ncbi:2OG-Fe dioxygenase family protein [Luteimonas sp. R10]|uniref:2OG-Fe dioxygenase family protein n=1 Tax=Luteimonas sp. R10 TaxID=3108176 RepID=UPI00308FF602|nr:2OG-Fe dioxygenase family protein [Luteimonas sp. R10]
MTILLSPPYLPIDGLPGAMRERGFAVLASADVASLSGTPLSVLAALRDSWDRLPEDTYLKDGGRYRRRRHSCFVVEGDAVTQVPHRAHWQPRDYNALHGGMRRWFEPIEPDIVAQPAWSGLLGGLGRLCSALDRERPWYVEAHQFRIDTSDGIGRPTPEGAHRDGVDYVAVLVVDRAGIKGGETRVFAADGPDGQRFTLTEPWGLLFLDDARVIHESTPIQPQNDRDHGHRDTLVLTWRASGFQGDG